jgi:signal transduction histidine kinase
MSQHQGHLLYSKETKVSPAIQMRISKTKSYFILQIASIAVYTGFIWFLMTFNGKVDGTYILEAFVFISIFVVFTHFFRAWAIRFDWFGMRFNRLIPRVLSASLLMGIILFPISVFNAVLWSTIGWNEALSTANIIYQIGFFTILFLLWSLIYFLFHYITSYQRSLKMAAVMKEAELNQLKSQLNPHFLFNALNSVRALVSENPEKAKVSITALSNLLRLSLVSGRKKLITLNEELATVKDYLSLEQIRFEERLEIQIECPKETLSFKVPPMMLQTIVENGIKHGISKLKEGGRIMVSSKIYNDALLLEVRNNGQYVNGKKKSSSGFGLELSRKRLELIYGSRASLEIRNENENTVLTELIIPENEYHENDNN